MILVTGGTGLVGAHLLYKLISNNEKVRAIYRNERKLDNTKNVFSCYTKDYTALFDAIEWVQADILDIPALTEAFAGVTKVYHCAAFVSFEPDKYHLLRKTNIEGTANIVNLSLAHNISKLCYVSSIAAIGQTINNNPISETTIWNPEDDHSVYAITKYGAEMEVWRGTQEGLDAVIVNPGVILGAGIWRYGTGSLFKKAKHGMRFYTSGTVALISVDDVINVMIQLMQSDIINERFVLVAENWTYKDFIQSLAKSVNAKLPKKMAGSILLNIAWKFDWLTHKITGKRRELTKHIVKSLTTETNYNNDKIKTALNLEFKAVNQTIRKIGSQFLNQ